MTDEEQRLLLEAWSLFDTWMSEDPTCKTVQGAEDRVRAFCANYGQYLKPEWNRIRLNLEMAARRGG